MPSDTSLHQPKPQDTPDARLAELTQKIEQVRHNRALRFLRDRKPADELH